MSNGPFLPNKELLEAMAIQPRGTCLSTSDVKGSDLQAETRRFLRIIDEQRAVNRYKWFNLPLDMSSQDLERLLYYKGHLAFFYFKELNQFAILPYALDGTIDLYGRYNFIHCIPMASGVDQKDEGKRDAKLTNLLSMKKLKVIKDVVLYEDEITEDLIDNSAVILRDYTNQLSQVNTPRYIINDKLIDTMADCIPFLRTSLMLGTGVRGMKVPDADCASEVSRAAKDMYKAAISGNPYVAITSDNVEFQDLQNGTALKAEEFMLAMQSLDNLILAGYGIDNNGLFEKKAHELQSEQAVNNSPVGLVLQDGLAQRQNFCNIVNSIWDLGIWCELSDTITHLDTDGNGTPYDDDMTGSQSGASGSEEEGGEDNA